MIPQVAAQHAFRTVPFAVQSTQREPLRRSRIEVYNPSTGTDVISKLSFEKFRQLPSDGKRYKVVQRHQNLMPDCGRNLARLKKFSNNPGRRMLR